MSKLDELVKLDAEFDEKFGIYSNYADFCPDKEEYKSFARRYYSLGKLEEREALKKELDLKVQKPEDYSYANGNDMESFCRGYNACKEYVEWVIDGKPKFDLLNELNKN